MECEQRANYTLEHHLPIAESTFPPYRKVRERRAKPRSSGMWPARAWGVNVDEQPFSIDCLIDNISASGIYLRLPRRMKFSDTIRLVVRLPYAAVDGRLAAINGTIVRNQMQHGGDTGVGVRIVEHSFI
jgi:hypothetical protein